MSLMVAGEDHYHGDISLSFDQIRNRQMVSDDEIAQVARATDFLCSDAADCMTSSVLLVDGSCSPFQFAEDES
jgi:hypothetical protein